MTIGSNIKNIRKKCQVTQVDLANRLSVDQETIVNWENDVEVPNDNQIAKIASILNVSYSDIVDDKKHENLVEATEAINIADLFKQYLNANEKILWTGSPKKSTVFSLPVTFFGLFFLGFSIFWTIMAFQASFIMSMFGIPFIIVGLFLVFIKKSKLSNFIPKQYYAVTDERILIIKSGHQEVLIQVALERLTNVILTPSLSGTSSITFYTRNEYGFYNSRPFFYYIENAQQVVDLINQHREKRHSM